jgi:hypothetical protein
VVSLTPRPRYSHWIRCWMGPRAGVDTVSNRRIPSSRRESSFPKCFISDFEYLLELGIRVNCPWALGTTLLKRIAEWSYSYKHSLTSVIVVSFKPRPLYPQGNSPYYPLHTRLGEYQSRCGRGGKIPSPCRDSNPRSSIP